MTKEQIINEILTEKGAQNSLSAIAVPGDAVFSKVSVFYQITWVFATICEVILGLFERHKREIEEAMAMAPIFTTGWYVKRIKEYQDGDELKVRDDYTIGYATIDTEKQVVKQTAVVFQDGVMRVKIAGLDESGTLVKIDNEVAQRFLSYMNQIKRPGTPVQVINYEPDLLVLYYKVYYNGQLVESEVESNVRSAVNDYLQNIVFNGVFNVTACTDRIQQVAGVIDPFFVSGSGRLYYQPEGDSVFIEDYYNSTAGYLAIDEDGLILEMIRKDRD